MLVEAIGRINNNQSTATTTESLSDVTVSIATESNTINVKKDVMKEMQTQFYVLNRGINMYFYDGGHSFEDHFQAVLHFLPVLSGEMCFKTLWT